MADGPRIEINGWRKFQHYKNRRPPWVKLHRSLLHKRQWRELSGSAAKLLIDLWLVAAEGQSASIAQSLPDLAWSLRISEADLSRDLLVLQASGFVTTYELFASTQLAPCLQVGPPETETETEAEGEGEKRELTLLSRSSLDSDVTAIWSHFLKASGRSTMILTDGRKKTIRGRLKTYSADQLRQAIDAAAKDEWLCGENDRGKNFFRIETIFKNDTKVAELLEAAGDEDKAADDWGGFGIVASAPPAWRKAVIGGSNGETRH